MVVKRHRPIGERLDFKRLELENGSVVFEGGPSRKLTRVTENLGAANVELTADDLTTIATAFAGMEIQGARLPEAVLKMSYL